MVSSSPIPGNEVRYQQIGNDLAELGCTIFRHESRDLDGCGPLHVSGHANQDELKEMVEMTRPKWVIPIHGGMLDRLDGYLFGGVVMVILLRGLA